jgi:hypothetical protein
MSAYYGTTLQPWCYAQRVSHLLQLHSFKLLLLQASFATAVQHFFAAVHLISYRPHSCCTCSSCCCPDGFCCCFAAAAGIKRQGMTAYKRYPAFLLASWLLPCWLLELLLHELL